jgi:hypothetical protein
MIAGLRFPKSLVSTRKDPAGHEISTTYAFDRIAINEVFPDSEFAVPPPQAPRSAASAAPAFATPSTPKPSE